MDEEQRRLEHYKLIFAHFNRMEQRYHTWMNYYSLFNGALLVAYCTILVSTGKIVEVEGNISVLRICLFWSVTVRKGIFSYNIIPAIRNAHSSVIIL